MANIHTKYPKTEEERFWPKVRKTKDCWLWTAHLFHDGYGQFDFGAKQGRAHRFAYTFFIGPIPEGYVIDHLCRVRHCVNPKHLEAVTQKENLRRGKGHGSETHCPHGHMYSPENTVVSNNKRYCRACRTRPSRQTRVS